MNTPHDFTSGATITEGERCEIDGLNIWDHEWKNTGERMIVTDTGGRKVSIPVNEICVDEKLVQFAINEVSNGVFVVFYK